MGHLRTHARGRGGYSLVELMVAMTAGAILISSGYILTRSSSEFFHRTARVATTQAGVRMAADRLRADIARAGFLGHPDTNGEVNDCLDPIAEGMTTLGGTADTVRTVEMTAATAGPADNPVRQDQLVLTGNYVTNERYGLLASPDYSTLRVDPSDPAFRRSFENLQSTSGLDADSIAAFEAAFAPPIASVGDPGRLVRIDIFEPSRHTFFRRIQSSDSDGANWEINITPPLPNDCAILTSHMEGGFVAPLTTFVYDMIDPASDANLARLTEYRGTGGDMEWALVRREVNYAGTGAEIIAGSERIVLEYALQFGLTALVCPTPGTSCPFTGLDVNTNLVGIDPAQVQGLRVSLAARTPELDPTFDPDGSLNDNMEPLVSWRPLDQSAQIGDAGSANYSAQAGRARVRSTTFDVALTNNQP